MSIDRRFSSTVPASLDALPEPVTASAPIEALRRADFEVAAAAAEEFGRSLAQLRDAVRQLGVDASLSKPQLRPIEIALDQAQRAVLHGRLLARVASGGLQQSPAPTPLAPLLQRAIDTRNRQADAGRRIERQITDVTAVVDPDVAAALVDALLDWCQLQGGSTQASLQMKDWPAHGLLTLRARIPLAAAEGADDEHERISWYLARELCQACGALIDRVQSPGQVMVMVEFPRTVREMDGVSAMEVDLGGSANPADAARVLAGHRALIISSDVKLREEAKRICTDMGLAVDNVPSSTLAQQRCEQSLPDLVIVDERFNDERFAQLRARLDARRPSFPMIEIAYEPDLPMSIAGWGGEGITRVGRGQLAAQLPQALALEMSKAL